MKNFYTLFVFLSIGVFASAPSFAQCFDITDLHASNVTCTTGSYANPYRNIGVVNGRHVVMSDTTAFDPNVPNLRTIPVGKQNSIRLGNSSVGAQAESITFDYYVDAANPILLLQYAAVMQNPNHTAAEQPRLVLQILNENDAPIDPTCTSFDFVSSQALGWNSMYSGSLLWKDWTSVGVDMSSYVGQTIKIRLTNYDCEHGGHYGYAYLYLDCAPLEIRSKACGDINAMVFSAPEGFQYSWYTMSGGRKVIKATTQEISVPVDGTIYYCEISQIGKPECAYTTSVVANARYPLAGFSIHQVAGCADTLYLTDLSGISEDGVHLNNPHEDCDIVLWDLGDGRTFASGHSAIAPITYAHTGTYTITQTVRLVDGNCYDVLSREVTVRGTDETHIGEIWETICLNVPYYFDGKQLTESGVYVQNATTDYGCDSTTVLHLTVNRAYEFVDTAYLCKNSTINFFEQLVDQQGEYFFNYTSINGCDSIYKLVVKEAPDYMEDIEATICDNETFDFNGRLLSKEGTYTDVLRSVYGCDSVVNLHLHVLPTYVIDRYVETCHKDTFWFRGRLIDEPGIFYDSLYTQHGCDSIFRFIYNQTPIFSFDAEETIMQGDSILFHGNYFSTPGMHTITYRTNSGCDSIYRLHLTVLPRYYFQEEASTCDNEPYIWHGHTYYEGGIYYDSLKTVLGHDSIYMLRLNIHPTYLIPTYVETCEGDPFDFRGRTITKAGVYYDSLYTHSGCDSVYMLVYNITPTYHFTDTVYMCQGATYHFHGMPLRNAGVYYDSLRTVSGCDSIYELHLHYYPNYVSEDSAVVCGNETFLWGGRILKETGVYRDTFQSIYGCDSVSVLHLTVNPVYAVNRNITLCPNEVFYIKNHALHVSDIYIDTLNSVSGCDSIVRYIFSENPNYVIESKVFICPGETYVFRGRTLDTPGTYTDTLHTIQGCDSVYRLLLSYYPTYEIHMVDTLDGGLETYDWRNFHLKETGIYYDSLQTIEGCDSVFVLHLTVNRPYLIPTYVETCEGDPFDFRGRTITKAGVYYDSLYTHMGCDSVYMLVYNITPTYRFTDTVYMCQGATYHFHGMPLRNAGVYYDSLRTVSGCDSIYELHLHYYPNYVTEDSAVVCGNETFTWGGRILNETGVYRDTFQSIYGCDSVSVLHLTVNPTYLIPTYVETCEGDPFDFRGRTITKAGVYYDSLYTHMGCDSVYMLVYNITPTYHFTDTVYMCQGATYHFHGMPLRNAGVYYDSLRTISGCDSIYELHLHYYPNYVSEDSAVVCGNETFLRGGRILNETGVYRDTFQSIYGCDSVSVLHLTVNPTYLIPTYVETCEGDPFDFRGRTITKAGVYYDSLYTHSGCDSVYMLVYNITPTYHFTDTVYMCQGATYHFHGMPLRNAGVYYDSLRTVSGCDSIYELHLHYYLNYVTEDSAVVCGNETFLWGGRILNETGVYRDTFQSIYGCDSVSVLHLTVNQNFVTERNISLCPSETFTVSGKMLRAPAVYFDTLMSVYGCDSVIRYVISLDPSYIREERVSICRGESYTFRGRVVTKSGTYTDTLKTLAGCDSIYRLTVSYKQSYEISKTDTVPCGVSSYEWRDRQFTESGVYYDSLVTVDGCDSVYVLHLTFRHTYLIPMYVETCEGDPFDFRGRTITRAGVYYDSLYTHSGCDSVYMLVYNITPTYHFTDTVSLCKGATYNFRGRVLSNTGVYFDSLRTVSGCDSVYELHLNIYPSYYTEDSVALCTSETYVWGGRELKVSGTYRDTFQTIHGCDSICVLHLNVRSSYLSHQHFNLCPSETFYISGVALHAPMIYYDTIMSSLGCDSVICYELALDPSYVIETQALLCPGDAYNFRGRTLTIPGTYVDTFHTVAGCDSIYRLILRHRPSYEFITTDTIECGTDPYEWRGKSYSQTGVYYDSLVTMEGCDSVYVLKLTYHRRYLLTVTDTVCSIHPYDFRGRILTQSGVYYDSLVTESGCDSIFKLKLTVFETLRDTLQEAVCITDSAMKADWPYAAEGEYIDTVCSTEEKRCHIRVVYFSILTPSEIFYANIPDVCGDDSLFEIDFRYNGAKPHTYSLYYGDDAHAQGFRDVVDVPFEGGVFGIVPTFPKDGYVRPDTYQVRLEFDNGACEPNLYGIDLTFRVRYPAWIIEQNWNDVIALLNERHNGGYVFSHYDWYVNGRLVDYAHGSNLYMQEVGVGDVVELYPTREGEDYSVPTCPVVIEDRRNCDVSDHPVLIYPTKVAKSQARVHVSAENAGNYVLYDMYGSVIVTGSTEAGESEISLPSVSGCYLMSLIQTNGHRSTTKLIVY